jgi:hypothetical protein
MYVFCVYEYSSTANLLNLICDTVGLISYILYIQYGWSWSDILYKQYCWADILYASNLGI